MAIFVLWSHSDFMNKGGNFLQHILKGIIAIVCLIILGIVAYLMMTPQDTAPQAQTRQVTDATGQVLTIPIHPQRVVFLNVSNLDLYYAAGGRDTIAGKPTSDSIDRVVKKYTKRYALTRACLAKRQSLFLLLQQINV